MANQKVRLWNDGRMKGGIRQRSSKSWEITIEFGRDAAGKRVQDTYTVQCTSYRQAVRERTRLLAERDARVLSRPDVLTLSEFLDRWERDYVSVSVRPQTARGYRSIIKNRLRPTLGNVRLSKLTAAHVISLYAQMRRQNGRIDGRPGTLSGYALINTHRVLKEALGHARKWGLIRHNPMDGVDAPRPSRVEVRALTADETRRLLFAAANAGVGSVIALAIYTGMRRSELLGLQWGDINIDLGVLQVVRGLHVLKNGELRYEAPKSKYGKRPVALSRSAVELLRRHRKAVEAHAGDLGIELVPQTPVFVRPGLEPMLPDTVSHQLSKIARRAGLGRVGMHTLRHTHATLMLEQGVHPLVVSRRLGHSTVQITLDIYSHVVPSIQAAAAEAFEIKLAGPTPENLWKVAVG